MYAIRSYYGAAEKALNHGYDPDVVIGDLDSLSPGLKEQLADKLIHIPDQDTNDLTKAVNYCLSRQISSVIILGATGQREDHTLGNIGLVAEYAEKLDVVLVTDYGYMYSITGKSVVASFPGQQVSLFAIRITSYNVCYTKLLRAD